MPRKFVLASNRLNWISLNFKQCITWSFQCPLDCNVPTRIKRIVRACKMPRITRFSRLTQNLQMDQLNDPRVLLHFYINKRRSTMKEHFVSTAALLWICTTTSNDTPYFFSLTEYYKEFKFIWSIWANVYESLQLNKLMHINSHYSALLLLFRNYSI